MVQERPKLVDDLKKLSQYAAMAGGGLAVLCHLLPPHYRIICDHIAQICKGNP